MKKNTLFILSILLLFACNSKPKEVFTVAKDSPKSGHITVVIKSYKQSTYGIPSLYYYDGYTEKTTFIKNVHKNDTVNIFSHIPQIEISYYHHNGVSYGYPATIGDTLTIDFKNDFPYVSSTNKNQSTLDYSWQNIFDNKYTDASKRDFRYYLFHGKDKNSNIDLCKNHLYIYNKRQLFLDSLYNTKQISKQAYSMYKQIIKLEKTTPFFLYKEAQELLPQDLSEIRLINDSLLIFNKYRTMLIISEMEKINMYRCNYKNYDVRKVFDYAFTDTTLTGKSKTITLFHLLKDISDDCNPKDFAERSLKFKSTIKDTTYLEYLKDITPTSLRFDITDDKNDLWLLDTDNNKVKFTDIIANQKGKVIYVDFWATWCSPCRSAMPSANILRKDYSEKDISFIYLALNDKEKPWLQAIPKLGINTNCKNYLIINSNTSKILKELNVHQIPRYLLFDKNGTLAHKNAPGPEDKVIRQEIDKLLAKTI